MKWQSWLDKWGMKSLKITTGFAEAGFAPRAGDQLAAWALYVELLTRTATQPLQGDVGDEEAALKSIYAIFPLTRQIIKEHGPACIEFTKIAIVVLNQVIRPFTAYWHPKSKQGAFADPEVRERFREDLEELQTSLSIYTRMLGDMASVEDLTTLTS